MVIEMKKTKQLDDKNREHTVLAWILDTLD
jgi:hypothetical protein